MVVLTWGRFDGGQFDCGRFDGGQFDCGRFDLEADFTGNQILETTA